MDEARSAVLRKDRLYLVEDEDDEGEEDEEEGEGEDGRLCGKRIFVLSLQGDTLQVYTNPVEGQIFYGLCCFDGKLLAPLMTKKTMFSVYCYEHVGVAALAGV